MFSLIVAFFYGIAAIASGFAALVFGLFTLIAAALLFHSLTDLTFSLRDRFWLTLMIALVITWGAWLTYMAGHFAFVWTTAA